jgi:hypothetical protein
VNACATCGKTILFGGKRRDDLRFCSDECAAQGDLVVAAQQVPEGVVIQTAAAWHRGDCPVCKERGPVDVHSSQWIYSYIVGTNWKTENPLTCRRCGMKRQLIGTLASLLAGWWGFPWGLLMTPVIIGRNIKGLIAPPDPSRPSAQMLAQVRLQLAADTLTRRG